VSQISGPEADDLLSKLFSERISLLAFFVTASGVRVNMRGFVDSKTSENGLVISESGSPIDVERGFISVRPFDRPCEFWYGEKRELSDEYLRVFADANGESALEMRFPDSDERFFLLFTL
jgi:hypothetical protein